ncbi:MAG: acyl-CoA dehydratase activase-related protein [Thermodesulfobacteriota bacterium]|nr:acyl-CoA dehydratase activase-related protein [Thermodesulfobacteriota bacterium]
MEPERDPILTFGIPRCLNIYENFPYVVKSAINPEGKYKIPFDNPAVSFRDNELLEKQLYIFFRQFGIDYRTVAKGLKLGLAAQTKFKKNLMTTAASLINEAKNKGRLILVWAGRPYHIDPLINHGIPELLTSMGVDVITEDTVPVDKNQSLADVDVLTQWAYTNRLYAAAGWVGKNNHSELIHLISFGCGLDAVSADEVRDILKGYGKKQVILYEDNYVMPTSKLRRYKSCQKIR